MKRTLILILIAVLAFAAAFLIARSLRRSEAPVQSPTLSAAPVTEAPPVQTAPATAVPTTPAPETPEITPEATTPPPVITPPAAPSEHAASGTDIYLHPVAPASDTDLAPEPAPAG